MAYGLNTLGPKPSQQGTTTVANTHGKVAPRLAGSIPADGFAAGKAQERGYQAPELAGNDAADSVSPGKLGQ